MNSAEILSKLDYLFENQLISEVEPFLIQQLNNALNTQKYDIILTIYNELIGYYRSISRHQNALEYSQYALDLIEKLNLQYTIEHATTLLNVATAKRAANYINEAIEDYQLVEKIYLLHTDTSPQLYASLYNNMSLAFSELNDFNQAYTKLKQALDILLEYDHDSVKIASTYVNLANVLINLKNYNSALEYINLALVIFETLPHSNSHYCNALLTKAQLFYLNGDFSNCLETYTLALKQILIHYGQNEMFISTCENIAVLLETIGHNHEAQLFKNKAQVAKYNLENESISGLELSKRYYLTYGKPMIEQLFPEYAPYIAIGLVGHGSECLGYDDDLSKDHDFGPGFCMWLTDEHYNQIGEQLNKAYNELPQTFLNVPKRNTTLQGQGRVGVRKISDFYNELIGSKDGNLSLLDWLYLPSSYLATATNGEVFEDPLGRFTSIRNKLKDGYPRDVLLKKIAARLSLMAQSGQYNFARSMIRQNIVAANTALNIFIQNTIELIYLINNVYCPYYKWAFTGLSHLEILNHLAPLIEQLVKLPLNTEVWKQAKMHELNLNDEHIVIIEQICTEVVLYLNRTQLSTLEDNYLDAHTSSIISLIKDETIKNRHVMEG